MLPGRPYAAWETLQPFFCPWMPRVSGSAAQHTMAHATAPAWCRHPSASAAAVAAAAAAPEPWLYSFTPRLPAPASRLQGRVLGSYIHACSRKVEAHTYMHLPRKSLPCREPSLLLPAPRRCALPLLPPSLQVMRRRWCYGTRARSSRWAA